MTQNQETSNSTEPSNTSSKNSVVLFGEVLADKFPDRAVLGGAPFNVARHLQAFGLSPVLITRVGKDQLGRELITVMEQLGMITEGVQQDPEHPTGQVIVHIEEGGHRFEIPPDQAYDFIDAHDASQIAQSVAPQLIYFGSLAQRHEVSFNALNHILQAVTSRRILDINLREPWYNLQRIQHSLRHAEIVKMNDDELALIAGLLKLPGDNAYAQAEVLIKQFSLQQLLVTCGAQGAWQLDRNGNRLLQQGADTTIVDTVGAGDGFTAVFITGTLRGWPSPVTLSRANAFAAALCSIRGAIPDNAEFYQSFLQAWQESSC